jgi:hypothetical protein
MNDRRSPDRLARLPPLSAIVLETTMLCARASLNVTVNVTVELVSNAPTPYFVERHSTWTIEPFERAVCWFAWMGLSHFGQTGSPFASRLVSRIGLASGSMRGVQPHTTPRPPCHVWSPTGRNTAHETERRLRLRQCPP